MEQRRGLAPLLCYLYFVDVYVLVLAENKPLILWSYYTTIIEEMEDNSAKRSKNFSKQELEVLVEEVVSRRKLLNGKLDSVVTADNKKRAWAKVAQSVSAVGEMERDASAIQKKWADVKSLVKKKLLRGRGR